MILQAVDIFCGAGGLSLGLQWSGIAVVAGIDNDPECRYSFTENIRAPFDEQDVNNVSIEKLNARFSPGAIRVLAGCAPCQPFSGYAAARGQVEDKRTDLLMSFLAIVEKILPEVVALENVARLVHRPIWAAFTSGLIALGYNVSWKVVDASTYGVPQKRRRLVLLASRLGAIEVPEGKSATISVREAVADLAAVDAGVRNAADPLHSARALTAVNLERIRGSRQSGTWRDWPTELRASCHQKAGGKTYPSVYGRMSWDEPSPTITTQFYGFGNGRFGHPVQDRAITLREGAILQSFPANFQFADPDKRMSFRSIGKLIGNAVPPKLGQAIGDTIVEHVAKYAKPCTTS